MKWQGNKMSVEQMAWHHQIFEVQLLSISTLNDQNQV